MISGTVKLWRAQVGHAEGVDVTAKSAGSLGRPFAPPWSLVGAMKRGELSWEEYTQRYMQQLAGVPLDALNALYMQGQLLGGELCLLCYCRTSIECHTILLIEFLTTRHPAHFEVKR